MNAFAALADPTRRRIVELLAAGEMSAGELAAGFSISAPAISQHLKILREANLVRSRVAAQHRIYATADEGFLELETWLAQVRGFWNPRLDRLEAELRKAATDPANRKSRAAAARPKPVKKNTKKSARNKTKNNARKKIKQ